MAKYSDEVFEGRKRSVENLKNLYTIVVSLSFAQALLSLSVKIFGNGFDIAGVGLSNYSEWYGDFFKTMCFLITVIPFFHGANRYLESTHMQQEIITKKLAIIVDFIVLFSESLIIFFLATFILSGYIFYFMLSILLLLDILWVNTTQSFKLPKHKENRLKNKFRLWSYINIGAFIIFIYLMFGYLYNNFSLYGHSFIVVNHDYIFAIICVIRTTLDYILVWNLYFPEDQIPSPPPGQPVKKKNKKKK